MKIALQTTASIALLAIAAFFSTLSWVVSQTPARLDGIRADVNVQALFLRAELAHQVESARADLLTRSERQLEAARVQILELTDRRIGDGLGVVDRRVGDSLIRVDTALEKVDGIVTIAGDLRDALEPTLENTASITGHANEASAILFRRDALPAQLLGVLGGAKVTLGQTAETMRDIQRATPGFIATWQQIGNHVSLTTDAAAKASLATQHTMENFAAASKPLPTWARIALGVGPPVAQMGAATAAAGSALHWIK